MTFLDTVWVLKLFIIKWLARSDRKTSGPCCQVVSLDKKLCSTLLHSTHRYRQHNAGVTTRCTSDGFASHPEGEQNYSQLLYATKTELSSGLSGKHMARVRLYLTSTKPFKCKIRQTPQ